MALRERRIIGEEILTFVDGEELKVKLYSVPSFMILKFNRMAREVEPNPENPKKTKVVVKDEELIRDIISYSLGTQVTVFDLENNIETELTPIYRKYFSNTLSKEKKAKSSDISQPNQDKKLEE